MYIIPKNVSQRFEFFPGFGWPELFLTLGGLGVGVLLFILLGFFTSSIGRGLVVIMAGATGFFLGKGDPRTGKTILSFIRDFRDWKLRQRVFLYYFGTGGEE